MERHLEMSGSWVTASIEGEALRNEVGIRIGATHTRLWPANPTAKAPRPLRHSIFCWPAWGRGTAHHRSKQYAATRNWSLEVIEVDLEIVSSAEFDERRPVAVPAGFVGSLSQREELLAVAEQSPVTLLLARAMRIRTELA